MSFQFQCPNGHLLEGEPAMAGQQCNCPTCGMLFIIPAPVAAPQAAPPNPFPQPGVAGGVPQSAGPSFPQFGPAAPTPPVDGPGNSTPKLLHIPCPNGHELEVPLDMLGQDVLCPHCQEQFHLRERDSVEFKTKQEKDRERREHRLGEAWLKWAIVFAVIVVIGLLAMMMASR